MDFYTELLIFGPIQNLVLLSMQIDHGDSWLLYQGKLAGIAIVILNGSAIIWYKSPISQSEGIHHQVFMEFIMKKIAFFSLCITFAHSLVSLHNCP